MGSTCISNYYFMLEVTFKGAYEDLLAYYLPFLNQIASEANVSLNSGISVHSLASGPVSLMIEISSKYE